MRLRSPNILLFLLAFVLVVVGVVQYLGIPINIPAIPGVAIPKAITDLPALPQLGAFWILFSGWLLLFVASVGTGRRVKATSREKAILAEVAAGGAPAEA
ncbi:MAG: hypothetical protein ACLPKB_14980 [Xanthobacteraceae bacterium]